MSEQPPSAATRNKPLAGQRSELTRFGGVVAGLALIVGAATDQAVQLSSQVVPQVPAPRLLSARVLVGIVGAVLLLWGMVGLFGLRGSHLTDWWRRRRVARPPAHDAGVPPDRNPRFSDRERELEELRQRLIRSRRVCLIGLGGVGKSALALEYLHRNCEHHYPSGAFWLRGASGTTLRADFAALAWLPELHLADRELREQEKVIAAVINWLRTRGHWLLVIDNLDEEAFSDFERLMARGLQGHVLVTSRVPVWEDAYLIEPMSSVVAARFLLGRIQQTDQRAAGEVAAILGGLPLALVQSAGYIRASGRDLASYAALLRDRLTEMLAEGKPADYPHMVGATWQISLDRVGRHHPAAVALLRLCCFMAPDDIPISVLHGSTEEMPETLGEARGNDIALDRLIAELRRYALVERQGDGLRVHRLVQEVVRGGLSAGEQRSWLTAVVKMLSAAFPQGVDNPASWQHCARLLPHVQTTTNLIGDRLIEPKATSRILDRAGTYLQARAEYALARPPLERALTIRERALGPNHSDTVTSLNNLALLLRDQGDLAAAKPLFERALAISERTENTVDTDIATSLNNLALLLRDQGDLRATRPLHERALAIREQRLGPEHPDTINSLNNLAAALWALGELAEAKVLLERVLTAEEVIGVQHREISAALNTLGLVLRDQGDLAGARTNSERSLDIRERVLGRDHHYTATSLTNLSDLLRRQGDLVTARALAERAVSICERVLGPDHPLTAHSLDNLALVLRDQRDFIAARALFDRALTIRERVVGPDHHHTAVSLSNLAKLLWDQGELVAAEVLVQRALAIRDRVLGPTHAMTVATRRELAAISSEVANVGTRLPEHDAGQRDASEGPARTKTEAE